MSAPRTISFLSDYGLDDDFVGVCHGVMAQLAPAVRVIDVTHGIPRHDIRTGALLLRRALPYLPPGVHLAVVDPDVGTERRAIALRTAEEDRLLVGPDNGLLAPAVALAGGAERAVELNNADWHLPSIGATFAGRDVFAPIAAQLCNGVDLTELGELVDADLLLPGVVALPQADDTKVIAQVLWVDRFGNAQLNVGPDDLPATFGPRVEVRCSSPTDPTGGVVRSAVRATSYAELGGGAVGLVLDSSGLLAVSMDQRSAAEELGLDVGDQVTLTASDDAGITQQVTLRRRS